MPAPIRILIADDHPVVRVGVRQMLLAEARFQVVGEARDGDEAICLLRGLRPDILLLDVAMPGSSGLEVLRRLHAEPGATRTILLTAGIERQDMLEALQLGACAVVTKDAAGRELLKAIHAVIAGQHWIGQHVVSSLVSLLKQQPPEQRQHDLFGLTPRELQVISTVAAGCTNKDIAHTLSISEDTVKRHLTHIFDKLGVSSRLELGLFAVHHNLLGSVAPTPPVSHLRVIPSHSLGIS